MMNRLCSGLHAPDYRYMNRDLPLIGDSCDRSPRKSGSHQTHRWREMDSNPRSPREGNDVHETAAFDRYGISLRLRVAGYGRGCSSDCRRRLGQRPATTPTHRDRGPFAPGK
jgi:hypothetical protein